MPYYGRRRSRYSTRRSPRRTRRFARSYRRRRYSRRAPSYKKINQPIVPDRIFVKLRYSAQSQISAGAATYKLTIYGNNLTTPSSVFSTAQPTGLDQWSAFYQQYCVLSAAIKIDVVNTDNTNGIFATLSTLNSTANVTWAEQPYTRNYMLGPNDTRPTRMKSYMTTKKIFGKRSVLEDDDFWATVSAGTSSPAQKWHFIVDFLAGDGSTNLVFQIQVNIVYYVCFFQRLNLVDSVV